MRGCILGLCLILSSFSFAQTRADLAVVDLAQSTAQLKARMNVLLYNNDCLRGEFALYSLMEMKRAGGLQNDTVELVYKAPWMNHITRGQIATAPLGEIFEAGELRNGIHFIYLRVRNAADALAADLRANSGANFETLWANFDFEFRNAYAFSLHYLVAGEIVLDQLWNQRAISGAHRDWYRQHLYALVEQSNVVLARAHILYDQLETYNVTIDRTNCWYCTNKAVQLDIKAKNTTYVQMGLYTENNGTRTYQAPNEVVTQAHANPSSPATATETSTSPSPSTPIGVQGEKPEVATPIKEEPTKAKKTAPLPPPPLNLPEAKVEPQPPSEPIAAEESGSETAENLPVEEVEPTSENGEEASEVGTAEETPEDEKEAVDPSV